MKLDSKLAAKLANLAHFETCINEEARRKKRLAQVPVDEIAHADPNPAGELLRVGFDAAGERYRVITPDAEVILIVREGRPTRRITLADVIKAVLEA